MISSKREEDQKREEEQQNDAKEAAFENGQSPEAVKKNPNPRANGNLPDDGPADKEDTTGVGSEITDGEAS